MSRTMKLGGVVALFLIAAVARTSSASLVGVVPNGSDSNFVSIDAGTGAATVVGATGFQNLQGLAVRADFTIFAAAGELSPVDLGTVITINPMTGAGTLVGPPGANPNGPIRSLTFSGGVLYASCNFFSLGNDTADSLCSVDQSTGEVTFIVRIQHPGTNTLRGVDGVEFDGSTMYVVANPPFFATGPGLFTVNSGTGAATLVGLVRDGGNVTLPASVRGLQLVGGTLYGSTSDGRLITIDKATGVYGVVGTNGLAISALGDLNIPPTPTNTPTHTPIATPTSTNTATPPPCTLSGASNVCIPSGGPKATDCYMEWLAKPVPPLKTNGLRKNKTTCYEGDPDCDLDPNIANNSCTFPTQICLNNADPRLPQCAPIDVATFEVKKPNPNHLVGVDTANLAVLEGQGDGAPGGFGLTVVRGTTVVTSGNSNNTPNTCSGELALQVPLKITTGGPRKATKVFRIKGTTSLGGKDTDALKLECRPSTCGNLIQE